MFNDNDLFVAHGGKDEGAGGKDRPLASLQGAVERVHHLKQSGLLRAPLTVWIRGGVYPLRRAVAITPEDAAPVCFRAYPDETPVFDGGLRLTGWEAATLNGLAVWKAAVPAEALRFGPINQFFVNGHRKTRAAFPKKRLSPGGGAAAPGDEGALQRQQLFLSRPRRLQPRLA